MVHILPVVFYIRISYLEALWDLPWLGVNVGVFFWFHQKNTPTYPFCHGDSQRPYLDAWNQILCEKGNHEIKKDKLTFGDITIILLVSMKLIKKCYGQQQLDGTWKRHSE